VNIGSRFLMAAYETDPVKKRLLLAPAMLEIDRRLIRYFRNGRVGEFLYKFAAEEDANRAKRR
jgi:hypothetical protein